MCGDRAYLNVTQSDGSLFPFFLKNFKDIEKKGLRRRYFFPFVNSLSRYFQYYHFSHSFFSFHAFSIYDVWTHEQLAAVSNKPQRKKILKGKHPLSPRIPICPLPPFWEYLLPLFFFTINFSRQKYPFSVRRTLVYTEKPRIVNSRIDLKHFHSRTFGSFHIFRLHSLHTLNIFLLALHEKIYWAQAKKGAFRCLKTCKISNKQKEKQTEKSKTGKLWVINHIKGDFLTHWNLVVSLASTHFRQQLKFKSTTIIVIPPGKGAQR